MWFFCLVAKPFVEFILLGIKKKYMYRERSVAHYGDEGTLYMYLLIGYRLTFSISMWSIPRGELWTFCDFLQIISLDSTVKLTSQEEMANLPLTPKQEPKDLQLLDC